MSQTDHDRLLNLGCGTRHHPAWTNVDIAPSSPTVLAHDLTVRLPFEDQSFDAVYASHVLEHFPRDVAPGFLRECRRVLRPAGLLRVVVPDLEAIAKLYLEALGKVQEDRAWEANYDWMTLELLDQLVRDRSGGAMADYLSRPDLPNRDFVVSRLGAEAQGIIDGAALHRREQPGSASSASRVPRVRALLRRARSAVRRPRAALPELLSGSDRDALQHGRFRRTGEVHQWMYDSYSLARLIEQAGFRAPRRVAAHESAIPGWTHYRLDTDADGRVYKPDSLFVEACAR